MHKLCRCSLGTLAIAGCRLQVWEAQKTTFEGSPAVVLTYHSKDGEEVEWPTCDAARSLENQHLSSCNWCPHSQ